MPQASDELRERWKNPETAFTQLGDNFIEEEGYIRAIPGYQPTVDDFSAIDYLRNEWDYGFIPALRDKDLR